jgi:hypothetical protein
MHRPSSEQPSSSIIPVVQSWDAHTGFVRPRALCLAQAAIARARAITLRAVRQRGNSIAEDYYLPEEGEPLLARLDDTRERTARLLGLDDYESSSR